MNGCSYELEEVLIVLAKRGWSALIPLRVVRGRGSASKNPTKTKAPPFCNIQTQKFQKSVSNVNLPVVRLEYLLYPLLEHRYRLLLSLLEALPVPLLEDLLLALLEALRVVTLLLLAVVPLLVAQLEQGLQE